MEEDIYSQLLVELECPVCTNYMSPPIRQCVTGHSICEQCRKRLPKCPLCQGKFSDAKNITLEALAGKMHYPCINKDSGCTAKLSLEERERHEATCMYKGFKCGMERCSWVGKYEEIEQHWAEKKMTSKPYGLNNICHSKLKADFAYVNLVKAHNKLFWFKCKADMGKVFWAVQYIGGGDEADGFYYQIELFKPGLTRRKAILSDYCHKIGVENAELFQEGVCLSLSMEALKQYVGDDQVLIYYLRVYEDKKKQEEGAEGGNVFEQQQHQVVSPNYTPPPPYNAHHHGHHHHQQQQQQRKQRGSSQHRPWTDKKAPHKPKN